MPTHGSSVHILPHMPPQEGSARCLVHPDDSGSDVSLPVSPVPERFCTGPMRRRLHETESSRAYAEVVAYAPDDLRILAEWMGADPKPLAHHRHAQLAAEKQIQALFRSGAEQDWVAVLEFPLLVLLHQPQDAGDQQPSPQFLRRTQYPSFGLLTHIPQFACAFFAKSLGECICKVEFIYNSAI